MYRLETDFWAMKTGIYILQENGKIYHWPAYDLDLLRSNKT